MSDRQFQYTHAVDEGFDGWKANITLPYAMAYDSAYTGFQATVKAQADADKSRADLFITAVSIVTGSILMATVASTSLRALAGKVALDVVCERNMNRTFDLMAVANDSQTFMFAVDKVLDAAKDKLKDQLKDTVTDLTNSTKHMVVATPLTQHLQLEQFLTRHKLACSKASDLVEAAPVGDGLKDAVYKALYKAPIITPPKAPIDVDRLSDKLELCFYMNLILDSDSLVTTDSQFLLGAETPPNSPSKPIPQMPSAPDYPRSTQGKMSGFTMGSSQSVVYDRPGSTIRRRIDELHQKVFRTKFYQGENLFGEVRPPEMAKELLLAEDVLNKLAQATRPMGYTDSKS